MSAIYKEGYWYPADSLNTLKAVTMSNEDYEALTPQEKEELGGIEIFIPDRPLTGGGTGAVIIYNGVEYAGTPTSRLETLEEIVGDGQQSVGSDLTDAVTQLNSSLTDVNIASVRRFVGVFTTGSTGNIATGITNDGLHYVVAPLVSGSNVFLRAWVSAVNGGWYLTAVDPNTGTTVNNTQLAIRFLIVTLKTIV